MFSEMKRHYLIILIFIIVIILLSWYLFIRFSHSKVLTYYSVESKNNSLLKIGIIGDSWVAGNKLDSLIYDGLLEKGIKTNIISSGHYGAKSKLIYQNLFRENENPYSSKFIIENRPDYCIVIAGVNDSSSQIGANFYSYHMTLIIKTLLHYNIIPIIVNCPEFGIVETTNKLGFFSKYRNIISSKFNNNGQIDNIHTYRSALENKLISENLSDSIILVNFDKVCQNYNECIDLYKNPSHLNTKGNIKLSKIIAEVLAKDIDQTLSKESVNK